MTLSGYEVSNRTDSLGKGKENLRSHLAQATSTQVQGPVQPPPPIVPSHPQIIHTNPVLPPPKLLSPLLPFFFQTAEDGKERGGGTWNNTAVP